MTASALIALCPNRIASDSQDSAQAKAKAKAKAARICFAQNSCVPLSHCISPDCRQKMTIYLCCMLVSDFKSRFEAMFLVCPQHWRACSQVTDRIPLTPVGNPLI
jgi:hypothetical protein